MNPEKQRVPDGLEKPVTRRIDSYAVRSLVYRLTLNSDTAAKFQKLFRTEPNALLTIAHWLDGRLREVPDECVFTPNVNEHIHRHVDAIEREIPPTRTFRISAQETSSTPSVLRLPCRDCGIGFDSHWRDGRFARTCGKCFAYEPKQPAHARGGRVLFKPGSYPKRRRGQILGAPQYGQDIVCGHPDCLRVFAVARDDRDYCPEHAEHHRQQIGRLRGSRPSKLERFLFRLAPGTNSVEYAWGVNAELTQVSSDGQFARDEKELLTLATLVAQGCVAAVDTLHFPARAA